MASTDDRDGSGDLVAALGAHDGDRMVVVNCDDLGVTEAANRAVYQALRDGAATSATLMTVCPAARDAVDRYEGDDIGVHLTLTAEWVETGYRWPSLTGAASLHDPDGYLWPTIQEVWDHADIGDARAECRAQMDQALAWGIDVTHVDCHMGVLQLHPDYHALYLDIAREYDVPIRLAAPPVERLFGFRWRDPAREAGLVFTDDFVYCEVGARPDVVGALGALRPGVTEVFLHPVVDTPEVRAQLPDAAKRIDDWQLLTAESTIDDLLAAAGAEPVGYAPLRAVQRERRGA